MWIPDPDAVWIGAILLEDWKPGQTTLSLETEEDLQVHWPNIFSSGCSALRFTIVYVCKLG